MVTVFAPFRDPFPHFLQLLQQPYRGAYGLVVFILQNVRISLAGSYNLWLKIIVCTHKRGGKVLGILEFF